MTTTNTAALDRKSINKEIFVMIIPMILENILQISAGLISTAMIGRLLASDVSAQGICVRVTDTLWCLYKGISIGATILIAYAHGAGDRNRGRHIVRQTFLTEIPISLIFSVVLFFFATPILSFLSNDTVLLDKAREYMSIIIVGFPFVVIMSVVTAAFQGHGDTKTPMLIAAVLNVVNIVCGLVLIFGVGSFQGFGIRGAAMSLVLSQGAAAVLGLTLLYGKHGPFGGMLWEKSQQLFDWPCVREIYTTGIPAALESMFWQFSAILLSKMILVYGSASFAAYQIGIQAETITEMPAIGFGTAATTLIARAIGKQDGELRKVYFRQLVSMSAKISIATSALLILLPNVFMSLMTTNEELKPIGAAYVFIMGFIQVPQNLSRVYNGALRAAGHKHTPMLVAGFGIWVVRIPLCFVASTLLHLPLISIWLIIALDQISRFVISVIVYRRAERRT